MENSTLNPRPEAHIKRILQGSLFFTALLCTAGTLQVQQAIAGLGYLDLSSKWRLGSAALLLIPACFWLAAFLSLTRLGNTCVPAYQAVKAYSKRPGKSTWFVLAASLAVFTVLAVGWQPNMTYGFYTRLFFFWLFGLAGFIALRKLQPQLSPALSLLSTGLIFGASYKAASFIPGINNYPLTLNWSETSNYLYSSFFVANRLYGFSTPLPFFNPGRALLGVVPFLLPQPQLWINRLWASLLWIGISGLTGWLISRRLRLAGRLAPFLFTLWAGLFLFQGPVYYELLLSAVPVIWLFNGRAFWRSLGVVIIASVWAGLCRINWFPMPGIVAAVLYFLETPAGQTSWLRYFWKPALWAAAGAGAAFLTFLGYNAISGNTTSTSGTALQSPLLWYRLLPSGTSGIGVLPMAVEVGLPAFLICAFWFSQKHKSFKRLRILAVIAILSVFFLGGLVVSTKIGGGSNIHNLDAFWLLLLLVTSFIYFNRAEPDRLTPHESFHPPWLFTAALVGLPIWLFLAQSPAQALPSENTIKELINQMNVFVSQASQNGQEVLFIDNKQLLTFGYFPGTKMVAEYETVYMLEMAMTDNTSYFEKFRQDLKNHRFGAIFVNPQPTRIQDVSESFAEENNAQIKWVGTPLLCYYQRTHTWLDLGVEVFTPQPGPVNCP